MLHHAYERGYYTEVMSKAREMHQLHPKMDFYKRWELAYQTAKQEFYENNPTEQLAR
jgi:hypothetical protein